VTPDAHLITLSDAFVGFVLPSKVHAAIESGRPILYIGSSRSDVHALCAERLKAPYIRVGIDDANGCWQALEELAHLSAASQGGDAAEMGGAKRSME
jgi:hypothetical protein